MNTIVLENKAIAAGMNCWVVDRMIYVELFDFRILAFPADRFIKLKNATIEELKDVRLRLNGMALRWDNLDEDISIQGILEGNFQLSL